MMKLTLKERANRLLNLATYAVADKSLDSFACEFDEQSAPPKEQYILRMLVKSPWSDGFQIPKSLRWLTPIIYWCDHRQYHLAIDQPFTYVTVRSGPLRSVTDDEWHVDGFSMRVPHIPEQNYIWCDSYPTEVVNQNFEFPKDFDPLVHNIHQFFQDRVLSHNVEQLQPKRLYAIDPYIVHRRPNLPEGTQRTFFRISFVPIEIEDDTNMPNPLLPTRHYGREDIRKTLLRY